MNDQLAEQTKELKKQFARTFHNDGLLDFFVGWSLVATGIFLQTSAIIWSFAGWMPILFLAPLKQRVIIPRFGYAKFAKPASIPRPILIGTGAVVVIATILVTLLGKTPGVRSPIIVGMLGLALLFILDKGWSRIAVYALFLPLFFIIGLGFNILTPLIIILAGISLMSLGVYLFLKFLQKYPLETGEEDRPL